MVRGSAGACGPLLLLLILAPACARAADPLPGAPPPDAALVKALAAAWSRRAPGYRPRTRHLRPDGSPLYTNRLFLESSPYLGQHAHNPVNWYPWGDEAFAAARALGRPVLLSVGYSTCHWCHVMEEESFEDEEIARTMNDNYIAIKVDREERPDIDAIYMSAVQALTGGGGWPMTVWLTPDRKPFYGGTYFPARDGDRGSRIGFLTLLGRLRQAYAEQPDGIAGQAARLTRAIEQGLGPARDAGSSGPGVLIEAARFYQGRFDRVHGGMTGAPKFPSSLPVRFLLRHHRRTGDGESLRMAALTLEKMAAGGMYDQVGGGFHRYSTDDRWLVPHFEKMLYDNALLTIDYLEGYQATGRQEFADVARDILRYVERDMTSPDGAFYSATDADSLNPQTGEREEGWFFTWMPEEIETVLGKERAGPVLAWYAVRPGGNFEGRSILHTPEPLPVVAGRLGLPPAGLTAAIGAARPELERARRARPAPLRDEKVLTAWNGLMIAALARAALTLDDASYAERAARAADFLLTHLRREGRLLRSFKDGRARHNGYLDDYASLITGLLDLHEATGAVRWLDEAIALDAVLEKHYEDREGGGFFMTSDDHETLLARAKPGYDGAEPSGNSLQALNLLRLAELTGGDGYRRRAARTLGAFAGTLASRPAALSEMLLAVDFSLDLPKEVVIITRGPRAPRQEAEPFLAKLREAFTPNRVLLVAAEGRDAAAQARRVPLIAEKTAAGGRPTAYVCERGVCDLPTTDPEVFGRLIGKVHPLRPADPAGR